MDLNQGLFWWVVIAIGATAVALACMVALTRLLSSRAEVQMAQAIEHARVQAQKGLVSEAMSGRHWRRATQALVMVLRESRPHPCRDQIRERARQEGLLNKLAGRTRHRQATVRGSAVFVLGLLGDESAINALIERLDDPDPDVRWTAIRALGYMQHPVAYQALIDWLKEAPAGLIDRGVEALAHPDAFSSILLAWPDANSALTLQLLRMLGLIKNPNGAPLAVSAAANSPPEVRVAAVRTLGQIASTAPEIAKSIQPTLIMSCQDSFWPVQAQAARALGAIGDEAAIGDLIPLLSHERWWVRGNAARALARCGRRGIQALTDIAENSDDVYARQRAQEELERVGARS